MWGKACLCLYQFYFMQNLIKEAFHSVRFNLRAPKNPGG